MYLPAVHASPSYTQLQLQLYAASSQFGNKHSSTAGATMFSPWQQRTAPPPTRIPATMSAHLCYSCTLSVSWPGKTVDKVKERYSNFCNVVLN